VGSPGGFGVKKQAFESRVRSHAGPGGRRPSSRTQGTQAPVSCGRLVEARWQVPTVAELQQEFPDLGVAPLLAHLAREGGVEQVDLERYASKPALEEFRGALERRSVSWAGPHRPSFAIGPG